MSALAWDHQFGRAVDAVGRLRSRHSDPDDYDRILLDRLAASLAALDGFFEPCAADLIRQGFGVEDAVATVDRHSDELYSKLGGRP